MKTTHTPKPWQLKSHSYQIADTGDYDGVCEITNGDISLLTTDDGDEELEAIVDALNNSGCKFYQDDAVQFENGLLKKEKKEIQDERDELLAALKEFMDLELERFKQMNAHLPEEIYACLNQKSSTLKKAEELISKIESGR